MLNIKILGSGCAKCYVVEKAAAAGLEALLREKPELEATLVHVQDLQEIEKYPILFTPSLVVNEKVVCSGRIPEKEEVVKWYREALDHGE